jgi:hypothetical protein
VRWPTTARFAGVPTLPDDDDDDAAAAALSSCLLATPLPWLTVCVCVCMSACLRMFAYVCLCVCAWCVSLAARPVPSSCPCQGRSLLRFVKVFGSLPFPMASKCPVNSPSPAPFLGLAASAVDQMLAVVTLEREACTVHTHTCAHTPFPFSTLTTGHQS